MRCAKALLVIGLIGCLISFSCQKKDDDPIYVPPEPYFSSYSYAITTLDGGTTLDSGFVTLSRTDTVSDIYMFTNTLLWLDFTVIDDQGGTISMTCVLEGPMADKGTITTTTDPWDYYYTPPVSILFDGTIVTLEFTCKDTIGFEGKHKIDAILTMP